MNSDSNSGPSRFAALLADLQLQGRILQLPVSARTAAEAASAIGCSVAAIAKSIVFRDAVCDSAIVVVASGANRVDTAKLRELTGVTPGRADAEFVRRETGYAIGGVPPFGYPAPLPTFIDDDLFCHRQIWAAAGGPYAVFATTAETLLIISEAQRAVIRVAD